MFLSHVFSKNCLLILVFVFWASSGGDALATDYRTEKCDCAEEANGDGVCTARVGGSSVDPIDKQGEAAVVTPVTTLSYHGGGGAWFADQDVRLAKISDIDIQLKVAPGKELRFHYDSGWVNTDTGITMYPSWSVDSSVQGGETGNLKAQDVTILHRSGSTVTTYVFGKFDGAEETPDNFPDGRLKTKTVHGETTSYTYDSNGTGAKLTAMAESHGPTITFQYGGSYLTKIIEPHPLGEKDSMPSPLDNVHGRVTYLTYENSLIGKVQIGMPNKPTADPGVDGNTAPTTADYTWRTTLLRNKVISGLSKLVAVVNPDQYYDSLDTCEYEADILKNAAAIYYTYDENANVTSETGAGSGCSSCGGGQAYEYLAQNLSDLDPTGDFSTGRNAAYREVRISRPISNGHVEIVQVNAQGQLVARWTEIGVMDGHSIQRLERRTYNDDGQLDRIYSYDVQDQLVPPTDYIIESGILHRVERHTYIDKKLTEVAISTDDLGWVKQVEYEYENSSFPALVTTETRCVDEAWSELGRRATDFTYDDQGRLIKTEHPTVTVNTDMAGGSYRPTEEQGYVSASDSRLAWTNDPEGIVTMFRYADNDGLLNAANIPIDSDPTDGSEGFELTRVTVDSENLKLETRHQYSVSAGVWRRTRTTIDPGMAANQNLNRQTTYVYTNHAWSEADNAAGAFGNVIAEYPPGGGCIYRTYDGADRVLTVKNTAFDGTLLAETAYVYDKFGKTKEVRQTLGKETYGTVNEYDTQERLSKVWERVRDYTGGNLGDYASDHKVLGNVTSYTYSGTTSLVTEIDKGARTDTGMEKVAEYAYDFMGRRTSQTTWVDATHSNVTAYDYDYRGRLTDEDPPTSAYTQYDYDNLDRRAETRRYENNAAGTLMAREVAYYDEGGRMYKREEFNPNDSQYLGATNYYYDKAGRLRKVEDPGTHSTFYTYDTAGRQYKTEDALGNTTLLRLNAAGETVRIARKNKLDATPTWRIEYVFQYLDDAGRLLLAADWGINEPANFVLEEEPANWAAELTPPAPLLASTSTAIRTLYAYDDLGRTVSVTDPENMTTSTSYDMLSRVASVTEDVGSDTHANRVTEYVYDQQDAEYVLYETVTAHNDSTPQATSYYRGDAVDVALVSQITYPDAGEVTFSFNRDGTLASKTDQRDWEISYARDGLGRVATETAKDENRDVFSIISYDYDALGRIIDAKDDNGEKDGNGDLIPDFSHVTVEYSWSSSSRLTSELQSVDDFTVTYMTLSRQISLDGVAISSWYRTILDRIVYNRDFLHRVTSMTSFSTTVASPGYKGLYLEKIGLYNSSGSRQVERTFTNTATLDGYDAWGRIARIHYTKYSSGDPIVDLAYARTSGSSPIYQQNNIVGAEAESELYAHDTLHRLTSVKRGELSFPDNVPTVASPAREQTWTLDTLGNWQAPSGLAIDSNDNGNPGVPSEARTHTVANQIDTITPEGGTQFNVTHDAAGNLTILPDRTNPATTADRFTYDCRNRLIKVEHTATYDQGTPTWNTVVRYYYDALNRLAKKHLPSQPANDIIYQHDGWRPAWLLKKTGGNWLLWMRCTYGPQYIDQPLLIDKDTDGDGSVTDAGGSVRYFLCQQANYNVVAVTEDDGDVVETVNYDPYGQPTLSGTATENTLLFQGQLWDSDAGLYCFRNRWYSPTLGRFMQRDPAGYADGMGLYEFVGGKVTRFVDAMGLAADVDFKDICCRCAKEAGGDCTVELCEKEAKALMDAYRTMSTKMKDHPESYGAFTGKSLGDVHHGWMCYHWARHTVNALKAVERKCWKVAVVGHAENEKLTHSWVTATVGPKCRAFGKCTVHFDPWAGNGPSVYTDEGHSKWKGNYGEGRWRMNKDGRTATSEGWRLDEEGNKIPMGDDDGRWKTWTSTEKWAGSAPYDPAK